MKSIIATTRLYTCTKVTSDPLNWQVADWMVISATEPFILASGAGPAKLQTQVRAVWTENALYLAFWSEDPEPWATKVKKDSNLYEEEVVEVFLAPSKDLTQYFEFEMNPLGTLFDALIQWYDLGIIDVNREWDCAGLSGNVVIERERGWWAFMTIPFAELQVKPRPGDVWRVNFYRIERRPRTEFSSWSPLFTDPPQYHNPERFGALQFVE